ncbi:hypothetical protein J7M23_01695 [Candidatus Sumerlaeota bacterium]|nr:hypothetical protein [Candidatus Sumerlaeota bacterium]
MVISLAIGLTFGDSINLVSGIVVRLTFAQNTGLWMAKTIPFSRRN